MDGWAIWHKEMGALKSSWMGGGWGILKVQKAPMGADCIVLFWFKILQWVHPSGDSKLEVGCAILAEFSGKIWVEFESLLQRQGYEWIWSHWGRV